MAKLAPIFRSRINLKILKHQWIIKSPCEKLKFWKYPWFRILWVDPYYRHILSFCRSNICYSYNLISTPSRQKVVSSGGLQHHTCLGLHTVMPDVFGFIWMLSLFAFYSCPKMNERMLKSRPAYKQYIKKTSSFILV